MRRTFIVKKARIETLSYVHINGAQFGVLDYIHDEDKIYLVNWKRVFLSSFSDEIKRVIDEIYADEQADFEKIKKILAEKIETLKKDKVIIDEIKTDFRSQSAKDTIVNIKFFIRYLNLKENSWQVYLPGSSVKGAFSSYYSNLRGEDFGFRDFYPRGEVKTVFKEFYRWKNKHFNPDNPNSKDKNTFYVEFIPPHQVFEGEFLIDKNANNLKSPEEVKKNLTIKNEEFSSSRPSNWEVILGERVKKGEYIFPVGFGFGKRGRMRFYDDQGPPLGLISLKIEE